MFKYKLIIYLLKKIMNSLRLYIRKIINETIEVITKITQEDLVEILKGYLEAAIWTEEEFS